VGTMVDRSPVYRFADLVFDPANRRLTRAGVEIYLQPKTFDTLLCLVERHGLLVTKRALLDMVWTETAVTDNALTQQISELREVLGDDARQPRFIRTLPRVGFTFIGRVDSTPYGVAEADAARAARPDLTSAEVAPVVVALSLVPPPPDSLIERVTKARLRTHLSGRLPPLCS
jgi:DNA-binding winged helix-turn-helix (wHTH) protein